MKNALIEDTMLGIEDHGILTAFLYLDYGDSGHQGFGGYSLSGKAASHFIRRCLEIAGVTEWKQLVGKTIRVDATHNKINGIGHIVKEDWFYPAEDWRAIND